MLFIVLVKTLEVTYKMKFSAIYFLYPPTNAKGMCQVVTSALNLLGWGKLFPKSKLGTLYHSMATQQFNPAVQIFDCVNFLRNK